MAIIRTVYNVIVRPVDEGGWWAEVVELPGCVSQGETKQELLSNIMEAIDACLEAEYDEDIEPQVELWGVPVINGSADKKELVGTN